MIKNYLKVACRQLFKYKMFSALNILGLATSMSVCLLVIMILMDQFSYDLFHEKKDRIYRVISDIEEKNAPAEVLFAENASAPMPIAEALQSSFEGVEHTTRLALIRSDTKSENKVIPLKGLWTEPSFFTVFSYGWLEGNQQLALQKPNSVVLTKTTAEKHFGTDNPVGRQLELNNLGMFLVTGVVPDPPLRSYLQFDFLASLSTRVRLEKEERTSLLLNNWENIYQSWVFLTLKPGFRKDYLTKGLQQIAMEQSHRSPKFNFAFEAQSLADITPGPALSNEVGFALPIFALYFLGGLGLIIILTACFNYTNLSIARALKRAREIGIRKVSGAQRPQIAVQFLTESILISLCSLLVAIFFLELLIPAFYDIDPLLSEFFHLSRSIPLYATFVLFSIIVGIVAGVFPALHLSKLQPKTILKNISSIKLFSRLALRKFLIIIQFALSLLFVISTIILLRQQNHMLSIDLGIKTNNIVNVDLQGMDYNHFTRSISQIPGIEEVSGSMIVPAVGLNDGMIVKRPNEVDSLAIDYNRVSSNFLSNMELKLIAGRSFPENTSMVEEKFVILNETAVQRLNMGTPQAAVGQPLLYKSRYGSGRWNTTPLTVIGVIEDFHYQNVARPIGAYGIRHNDRQLDFANINISGSEIPATIAGLKSAWKELDPVHEFKYSFYDEETAKRFRHFTVISRIVGFVAFLAIIIACLGLLGMVTYAVEGRIKEIGIRKVLGATEGNLIWNLSRGFIQIMGIAAIIALPAAWLLNNIWLQSLATRISVGFEILLIGVALIFCLGLLTIIPQTYRAATSNPSDMLRTE